MSEQHSTADEFNHLEQTLRGLKPAAPALARDELMFRAGAAAQGRGSWYWPALAAVLGLTTAWLGLAQLLQSGPKVVERTIYVTVHDPGAQPPIPEPPESPVPTPTPEPTPLVFEPSWRSTSAPYLHLRQQVLRWGAEELPVVAGSGSEQPAPSPMDLLRIEEWKWE